MIINDGTGKGNKVEVTSMNQLRTKAVVESLEHFANTSLGEAFSITVQQTPTGANDTIFYFKNTDTKSYVIEGFDYRGTSAQGIEIYLNSIGSPVGGSSLTAANLNTASSKTVTATIEGGNNITGLSGGTLVNRYFLTSTETKHKNFEQDMNIAPGGVFSILATTGAVQTDLTILLHRSEL